MKMKMKIKNNKKQPEKKFSLQNFYSLQIEKYKSEIWLENGNNLFVFVPISFTIGIERS